MVNVLFLSVGALALIAGVARAVALRRRDTPALRALCLILFALGLAFVLLSDTAQALESRLYPNLGRLLANAATLVAAFGALALLLHVNHPPDVARPRVRIRLAVALAAITALAVLFFISRTPAPTGTFSSLYGQQPSLAAYALVYATFLGFAVGELGWLSWRYSRFIRRRYLRAGLQTITVGCVLALGYVVDKIVSVAQEVIGPSELGAPAGLCPSPVSSVGCAMSVALPAAAVIVAGVTMPMWGPWLELPGRWLVQWRYYRRLRPLWAALHDVLPEIALASPSAVTGSYSRHDVGIRLYRRVIEIRDGALLLRDYHDPTLSTAAESAARHAGLSGERLRATVEATELAAAIEAKRRNRRASSTASPPPAALEPDVRSEARWLAQVAAAFRRSPIVAEQARRAAQPVREAAREH